MATGNRAAEYLGKAVTAARAERGMKRTALEEKSELSYAYLSEIEKGRKYPSQAAIAKIADALDVAPFELLSRAEMLDRTEGGTTRDPFASVDSSLGLALDAPQQMRAPSGEEPPATGAQPAPGNAYALGLRGSATGPSPLGVDDVVGAVTEEVYRTVEPRMREWLIREIHLTVREQLLRQREGR